MIFSSSKDFHPWYILWANWRLTRKLQQWQWLKTVVNFSIINVSFVWWASLFTNSSYEPNEPYISGFILKFHQGISPGIQKMGETYYPVGCAAVGTTSSCDLINKWIIELQSCLKNSNFPLFNWIVKSWSTKVIYTTRVTRCHLCHLEGVSS